MLPYGFSIILIFIIELILVANTFSFSLLNSIFRRSSISNLDASNSVFPFYTILPTKFLEVYRANRYVTVLHNSVDTELLSVQPDIKKFTEFFREVAGENLEIDKFQFIRYSEVAGLVENGSIYQDDLDDLWQSLTGDSKGLNLEEAYEMLCMLYDIPDPEEEEFLDKEFEKLTAEKPLELSRSSRGIKALKYRKLSEEQRLLTFTKFLNWSDVQEMINEEVLSAEEITNIWRDTIGDLNAKIDRTQFGKINKLLDEAIDKKEEENPEELGQIINPWDREFDPKSVFDLESLEDITSYFNSNAITNATNEKLFSYDNLLSWNDIKELVDEGALTKEALSVAWKEAVSSSGSDNDLIDYNNFLRLNVRLDILMDEIEDMNSIPTEDKVESTNVIETDTAEDFYRSQFKLMTGGSRLLRLDQLLQWKEIVGLIDDKAITEKQVSRMFEALPQEPMGIPSTVFGITEDSFVYFNSMLDVVLDSKEGGNEFANSKINSIMKSATTPSLLVSEPPNPMPKDAELKIGSLGKASEDASLDDDASTGLSGKELEMMELLDKADNMLNSGSYGDFDQLIGDLNDPRLAALREKRDGAEEVRGQLKDVLDELLSLGRKQKRCGLDKPDEEEAARIRDLVQAVIEKSPKIASTKSIPEIRAAVNGKWKLLYSNSEMLDFYNGVTGFANVFPTSKFQDLSMEYQSDGYLSDAKYFETLSTPLGPINAVVYANWDLVKEISFMTNDNSVVLRNYCTKVTAGPMEYEAQENWKSLRTMSMNEVVYVDDRIKITRNCGALRIYFLFEREIV